MATTTTDLYRSVMGRERKFKITVGLYPGDGMLDPRWENTTYKSKGVEKTSFADVTVVKGVKEAEVVPGGGTSLHDVSGWFKCPEFWIPEGTEYSAEINIKKDAGKKTSAGTGVSGHHYQLEARTQMTVVSFKGHLDNMARAAVVRQVALAKVK